MNTYGPRSIALAGLLFAATGCAGVWDELTSKERDFAYVTGIGKPNPLLVIRDSTDGARRAQAVGELREPLQHGGNAQDQEAYLSILAKVAKEDREPLCRLTAIRALGKYRDPRAARTLEEVYQQKTHLFTITDYNALIRKEAIVALGNIKDPESRHLLVRVARQPGPPVNADLTDRQQTQDEKAVAIRALKHYKQQESVDALVHVLKTEKDIALRDCAHEALQEVTGKTFPRDREAWQRDDIRPQPALAGENALIQRVSGIFQK